MTITTEQKNILRQMEEFAAANRVPIIRQDAARLLCGTVERLQPRRVLELGTAIGYSTLLLALSAPKAQIVTLEIDQNRQDLARQFLQTAGVAARIELFLGDLNEYRHTGQYDFVFIDAAKGQYPRYLTKVLPHLAPNTCIAADNVLFRGYVLGGEAVPRRYRTIVKRLREYLQLVDPAHGFQTDIYPDGDGLAISCRKNEKGTID